MFLELLVLVGDVLSLLLLLGELLVESADVVLFGEELMLERSNQLSLVFVAVLVLWFSLLFMLCFVTMF